MLSKEAAHKVTQAVLARSKADEVYVSLTSSQRNHLRFARNSPSTSGVDKDLSLTVFSSFGTRTASATCNQLDADSIAQVVATSEALARLAPEDPEHMPVLGPQNYQCLDSLEDGALEQGSEQLAQGTSDAIERARAAGLVAAGYSSAGASTSCIATSRGLFGYHRSMSAAFSVTARTGDGQGSGWASDVGTSIKQLDFGGTAAVAAEKAVASAPRRELAPGRYVTILEPACVASMIEILSSNLSARAADEGRSYFSAGAGRNRIGETLFPTSVTLESNPASPLVAGSPWGGDGVPQERRLWIDRGTLTALACDRYWAQKQQRQPVPGPSNRILHGDTGTLQDLVRSTERGVLITSLWYIRLVDEQSMLHTGLTRDGVFWIEDGKVQYPVSNFRWNNSPISVLKNIEGMSTPVRVSPRASGSSRYLVPALRVKEFELTSVSDAV